MSPLKHTPQLSPRREGLPELSVTQSPDGDGLLVTSSPSLL